MIFSKGLYNYVHAINLPDGAYRLNNRSSAYDELFQQPVCGYNNFNHSFERNHHIYSDIASSDNFVKNIFAG